MALSKILVPIDGSDGANRALEMAKTLAETNPEMQIDVLYVAPIPALSEEANAELGHIIILMKEDGNAILQTALDFLGDTAEQADVMCLAGVNPSAEIVKLLEKGGYDLVVMGNRGLSGRKEYTGSVSYRVLHASPVAVLIAK